MPEITVEIDVWCGECGDGLCNQTDIRPNRHGYGTNVHVAPCQKCLDGARDEGYAKGYSKRAEEGFEEEAK